MISKKTQYYFNPNTLTFEEVKSPFRHTSKKFLTYFFSLSTIAIVLLFSLSAFPGLPKEYIQKYQIQQHTQKYQTLAQQIDSSSALLSKVLYKNDQNYRDILEMDSVSVNIRNAGTGGSVAAQLVINDNSDKLISEIYTEAYLLEKQLQVQNKSFTDILEKAHSRNSKLDCFPGIIPVKPESQITITSSFGGRSDPFTFSARMHEGIDLAGPSGTKIYSTARGTATFANLSRKGYGNEVIIDHGFGYKTHYAHLQKILVKEGQKVNRGDLIGLMGNTGRSTGTHLHYEVRFYNQPLNPLYFFSDNLNAEEFELIVSKNTN